MSCPCCGDTLGTAELSQVLPVRPFPIFQSKSCRNADGREKTRTPIPQQHPGVASGTPHPHPPLKPGLATAREEKTQRTTFVLNV